MTETLKNNDVRLYTSYSDEALIPLIAKGDQQAYALLVQRYTQKIMHLATSILKSSDEAQDVTQDVFIVLLKTLKDWDHTKSAKFSTWIYRVAFNKAIDHKRKKRFAELPDDLQIPTLEKDGYQHVFEQEVSNQVADLLDELPQSQKDALFMYYFKEMTVNEISQSMKKTDQSVRSLIKRGKAILKDKFATGGRALDWDLAHSLLS